jgi:hypothetical protein
VHRQRLLRRDGLLFVSVPDAGSFKDHVDAPYQEFSVEHINYFTGRSLRERDGRPRATRSSRSEPSCCRWAATADGPALEAVYRWDGVARPPQPDPSGADAHPRVHRVDAEKEARLSRRSSAWLSEAERIYVWGTGTHTLHLLQTSRLGDCRIEAFLDSNPHYAGGAACRTPRDRAIDAAGGRCAHPRVVGRQPVGHREAARERFGPDVPLILLY